MQPYRRRKTTTTRLGKWLPESPGGLKDWLKKTIGDAQNRKQPFHPVIKEFEQLIENDPVVNMYFSQMFSNQPPFEPPAGSGDLKLENYQQMLTVLNHILTLAPEFDATEMVGCPINAILDFPMITDAGLAAFASDKVNAIIREVLIVWKSFLDSSASRYVLNDSPNGWFGETARRALKLEEFEIKSSDPFLGFKSWNDFFIRRFQPGRRPVAQPDNPKAVVSACESKPFAIEKQVKRTNNFWIKSQPYSLVHLLNGHYVDQFVGGTVYQAFLSAENYHRWHCPVTGTIKKFETVPGTYYSEAASVGFDAAGPTNSQGYLAHVATRVLIFIEADDPQIGLVGLVFVGMAEVSSCIVKDANDQPLKKGQELTKGDQLGYFQFGGSTYCTVFRPGAISQFSAEAIPQGENGVQSAIVKVNSLLAIG